MNGGRVRVLYLGGLGRSGSTVIERLTGQLPGVCAVGELVHLWDRGVTDGERCRSQKRTTRYDQSRLPVSTY